jgi:hypothetical protein
LRDEIALAIKRQDHGEARWWLRRRQAAGTTRRGPLGAGRLWWAWLQGGAPDWPGGEPGNTIGVPAVIGASVQDQGSPRGNGPDRGRPRTARHRRPRRVVFVTGVKDGDRAGPSVLYLPNRGFYAWIANMPSDEPVTVTEILSLPTTPRGWPPTASVSADGRTAAWVRTLVPRDYRIRSAWTVAAGDPLGEYDLTILITGSLYSCHFRVVPPAPTSALSPRPSHDAPTARRDEEGTTPGARSGDNEDRENIDEPRQHAFATDSAVRPRSITGNDPEAHGGEVVPRPHDSDQQRGGPLLPLTILGAALALASALLGLW